MFFLGAKTICADLTTRKAYINKHTLSYPLHMCTCILSCIHTYMHIYTHTHTHRFLSMMPTPTYFIVFSFLLRTVEGVGTAMYTTVSYTVLTQLFPDKKGTIVVSVL